MTSNLQVAGALIQCSRRVGQGFSDALPNDVLFLCDTPQQRILLGSASGCNAALVVSSSAATASSLDVLGGMGVGGALSAGGVLDVVGAGTFRGALAASNVTVRGSLTACNGAALLGALTACNALAVHGPLAALGGASACNLVALGAASCCNALLVQGALTAAGGLSAPAGASVCNLSAQGAAVSGLVALDAATFCNAVEAAGPLAGANLAQAFKAASGSGALPPVTATVRWANVVADGSAPLALAVDVLTSTAGGAAQAGFTLLVDTLAAAVAAAAPTHVLRSGALADAALPSVRVGSASLDTRTSARVVVDPGAVPAGNCALCVAVRLVNAAPAAGRVTIS